MERLIADPEGVLRTMSANEIAAILEQASNAYYNTSTPLLKDDMFDLIKAHLKKVAPKHPFLKKIGAPANGTKVDLPFWMGSLDKIRDDPKALQKWKTKYAGKYVVSDKLDGNSAMVVYKKQQVTLYSRGDGFQGQDISHLIPHLSTLPANIPMDIAVRGELIMSKDNWARVQDTGANARNVVAGIMHSKVPDPKLTSLVDFVAYDILSPKTSTLSANLAKLAELGFKVVHHTLQEDAHLTQDVLSEELMDRRKHSPYEIDGIVVVHDAVHKPVKGKNPAYGFAFKSILTHEEAEVVVREVEWNASKDGYLKPLIHFDTVSLAGVKIAKATGFNAQYIEKNVIGPGSRVVIIRSGDVIPHILRVLSPSTSGQPSFPRDVDFEWNDTHVDIKVLGASSAVEVKQLEHFCASLDVNHVAAGTIKKMYDHGINTIPKLLRVTEEQLLKIDGFQITSAKRVVQGIAAVKNASCADIMVASNLFGRGLGKKKIASITAAFPGILRGEAPSVQELVAIDGIGQSTATAFVERLPAFFAFMQDTGLACLQPDQPTNNAFHDFTGEVIVFTGFRNKEWESLVKEGGGKVVTSVSKNTTLVVAANPKDTSSKVTKAQELGIRIVDRDAFEKEYLLM